MTNIDLPRSRKDALGLGINRYFTGNPCARGHICERKVHDHECIECGKIKFKKYRITHSEKRKKYKQQWAKKNRKKIGEYNRRKYRENPEFYNIVGRNRRAIKSKADGRHNAEDIKNIKKLQNNKCAACNKRIKKKYHVDHIYPLSKGGSNWPSNLQILCQFCNISKHAKDPIKWAQENGRLL